jgi:PAS domain S-box-containing protein
MDRDLRFSYFSERFTKITGVPADALLGKTRQETEIPGVDEGAWQRHLDDLQTRRPFRNFTHPRTKPDGSVVYLSINGKPVFDDGGQFAGFRGTGADVTARINAEQALREAHGELERRVEERTRDLRRAKDEAELADRTKTQFLANMSHELRTPLNAIIGFSEMIRGEIFGPIGDGKYATYLDVIHKSGTHLLSLITDILDISRMEAGKLDLDDDIIDVSAMVMETAKMVLYRAQGFGVELSAEVPDDLPSLCADRLRVK